MLQRRFFAGSAQLLGKTSSKRWLDRQSRDAFTKQSGNDNYRSRAAYKLIELDDKFRLFKPGSTVVDLGFAPGAWSQVAARRSRPHGKVIGVDMLPAQPPPGVSSIQGNFLSKSVQEKLKEVLKSPATGRIHGPTTKLHSDDKQRQVARESRIEGSIGALNTHTQRVIEKQIQGHESEMQSTLDLVLSDMCGIFPQTSGFWTNSINHAYNRLGNVSGLIAKDHTASIDLCDAALVFCVENLRPGGSFVCKFYTGEEDFLLETRLKRVFSKVHRVKPKASRDESKEAYFVCQRKHPGITVDIAFKGT